MVKRGEGDPAETPTQAPTRWDTHLNNSRTRHGDKCDGKSREEEEQLPSAEEEKTPGMDFFFPSMNKSSIFCQQVVCPDTPFFKETYDNQAAVF